MNININVGGKRMPNPIFVNATQLLTYFLNDEDQLTQELLFPKEKKHFITTDKEVYEALSSIKKYDNFKLNKVVKLFELVDVYSYAQQTQRNKDMVTFEKIDALRKQALSQGETK